MRLDMHSRQEILKAHFKDYQNASKKGRKELLDRLAPVTGLNRSNLATALGNYGKKNGMAETGIKGKRNPRPKGKRGGRPVKYGKTFTKILSTIWDDYGKSCGKLLVPIMRGIIDFLSGSKEPDYGITGEDRKLLMEVSAAVLKSNKVHSKWHLLFVFEKPLLQ
jgi:hypothetical protein